MTEETTKEELEAANAEAAASGLVGETVAGDEGNGEVAGASTASVNEGNDTTAGETPDAPAEPASTASVDAGESAAPAEIPTSGGEVPTEPVLIGTFTIFRSRFDGQFLIKHEGGKGYSAPNASTAGHVASNLVAEVVQESLNGKFEYAAGAA